ncbi:hypothetical protein jhhlp_005532 [Lomentospora prolificans]|uniref:Uncharacterized protein n=1 Tax=Lomentospora prolificans TaxID=41688 RepID=A0A2N3N3C3_9PEZI|nr:hypothetical protein jhhlp_005532 [Lomentospora prolificans]
MLYYHWRIQFTTSATSVAYSRSGTTPFRNDWAEVISAIIEMKANLNSQDERGRTALSYYAEIGREILDVERLMDLGLWLLEQRDDKARTPLLLASELRHRRVAELLLDTGQVDADAKDNRGRTPPSGAAGDAHEAIVKLLVATGMSMLMQKMMMAGRRNHGLPGMSMRLSSSF